MSSEEAYIPPSPPEGNRSKKRLRLLLLLVVVVVVVLGAFAIFNHTKPTATTATTTTNKFRITTTAPDTKDVTTQTTSMTINFNLPIEAKSAIITSSPSIITATSIAGNKLTLMFALKTLVSTNTYTITINSISSTAGERLDNQLVTFKPTFVAPTTSGEDALINIGLSTDQVNSLFSYISRFDPWAQNVVVDESSIKHYKENPTDAWSPWAVSFSLNVDGSNYTVVNDFDDTEHIQVKIYIPTTNQLLFTDGSTGSY